MGKVDDEKGKVGGGKEGGPRRREAVVEKEEKGGDKFQEDEPLSKRKEGRKRDRGGDVRGTIATI